MGRDGECVDADGWGDGGDVAADGGVTAAAGGFVIVGMVARLGWIICPTGYGNYVRRCGPAE